MRRKWEKGDFVYFSFHNFLLELSALRGQRNHKIFELGNPSRKRQRPELGMEINHGKVGKYGKEEAGQMADD
jgi:hypothetical protein